MKPYLPAAAILLACCDAGLAVAGPDTPIAVTSSTEKTISEVRPRRIIFAGGRFVNQTNHTEPAKIIEIEETPQPVYVRRVVRPRRQAFIMGNNRYEPRLRDIRLLPVGTTLPQTMPGSIETLPVLPPQVDGYFVIPRTR